MIITLLLLTFCHLSAATPNISLQKGVEPPQFLSQTNLFEGEVINLVPKDLMSYDVNQPLFVDYAKKQRFFYVPGKNLVTFSKDGPFGFPVGTVFVKHFTMETSKGTFQNLETRVLIRKEGTDQQNWVGYTYQWKGSDAELVNGTDSPEIPLTVDATAIGGARQQVFKIPNRAQCLQCHNSSVGFVRSQEVLQLNRLDLAGKNQLEEFERAGVFSSSIGSILDLPKYANISDESQSLDARVKSYLAVNCAHCHNPDPEAMCNFTGLDLRYSTFTPEALVASGHLIKGAKDSSEVYLRMNSLRPRYRMPYFGAALIDPAAVDVVGRWIDALN